jgi:hypothetical protein
MKLRLPPLRPYPHNPRRVHDLYFYGAALLVAMVLFFLSR